MKNTEASHPGKQADAFISEHREFLEDESTSSDVLGRILQQGADVAVELAGSVEAKYNAAAEAKVELEAAIRDTSVSARELQRLERVHRQLVDECREANTYLYRFTEFMDEVQERYHERQDDEATEFWSVNILSNAPQAVDGLPDKPVLRGQPL